MDDARVLGYLGALRVEDEAEQGEMLRAIKAWPNAIAYGLDSDYLDLVELLSRIRAPFVIFAGRNTARLIWLALRWDDEEGQLVELTPSPLNPDASDSKRRRPVRSRVRSAPRRSTVERVSPASP